MSKRKGSKVTSLPVVEANAAAADIGATQIFVGAPPDRDTEPIRCFDTFTADLERLADWLEQCQIRTVAMESTGVYWIPQEYDTTVFQDLERVQDQKKPNSEPRPVSPVSNSSGWRLSLKSELSKVRTARIPNVKNM